MVVEEITVVDYLCSRKFCNTGGTAIRYSSLLYLAGVLVVYININFA